MDGFERRQNSEGRGVQDRVLLWVTRGHWDLSERERKCRRGSSWRGRTFSRDRKQLWVGLAWRASPVRSEVCGEVAEGTWECGM